jgi:hypothetical protein
MSAKEHKMETGSNIDKIREYRCVLRDTIRTWSPLYTQTKACPQ